MLAIQSYIIANLALALFIAYRRPSHAWRDAPAFFVVVAAILTIPVAVVEFVKEAWKR